MQKLQNCVQTLVACLIYEELSFCHFPPLNTSILGKDSQNLVDLPFEYLSFPNKRKTTILFPSPLTFLQWAMAFHSKLFYDFHVFTCSSKNREKDLKSWS